MLRCGTRTTGQLVMDGCNYYLVMMMMRMMRMMRMMMVMMMMVMMRMTVVMMMVMMVNIQVDMELVQLVSWLWMDAIAIAIQLLESPLDSPIPAVSQKASSGDISGTKRGIIDPLV